MRMGLAILFIGHPSTLFWRKELSISESLKQYCIFIYRKIKSVCFLIFEECKRHHLRMRNKINGIITILSHFNASYDYNSSSLLRILSFQVVLTCFFARHLTVNNASLKFLRCDSCFALRVHFLI
jgi:hypothetical protein